MNEQVQLPLLRVCRLLNNAGAKYLVCGAQACILHGLVRTTEDVDILVQATEENCQRVIDALAQLEDGAARELTPRDVLDNVVVKVADEVEVDISTKAWKVGYDDAITKAKDTRIDGVVIPFLGFQIITPHWTAILANKPSSERRSPVQVIESIDRRSDSPS